MLGDYLSTGLGALGLSWQAGPALTELEEVVVDWMRQLVGLSDGWSGVIQDTASTSTMIALICARERTSDYALARGGLQASEAPLTVYVCAHSHSSVDKGALLAGFGRDNLRLIPFDEAYAMRPDALEAAIQADIAAGRKPCAVVATSGTTATTALDPIEAIAAVAKRHGLWLHVDAAMAGSAMILPECRWMWRGVEAADSLVFNPHKWLGVAFDCSLYYVRDPQHLVRIMSTNPSFLRSNVDGEVKNLRDWGIPLGRRFRALKLWCLLRAEGVEALQARLRRDIENARWLARGSLGGRRAGSCSRRFRCRPSACATSPRGWRARRSIGIRSAGPRRSTDLERPISRRRSSTAAGWCASRSARFRRSGSMSRRCGG